MTQQKGEKGGEATLGLPDRSSLIASFDTPVDRSGTGASKFERAGGLLPMGTADMDFRAPECVFEAANGVLDHGILGYGTDMDSYRERVAWWMQTRHSWTLDPDRVVPLPGTLAGLALAIDVFTAPGDEVVIFEPVYGYFRKTIEACGRRAVAIPLEEREGRWSLPQDLEQIDLAGHAKLLAFCSPHNPIGKVWTRSELDRVLAFARRNNLVVVSDEIHCDLVYPGAQHIPMPLVATEADRVVTLAGATKTFNLPGLAVSNAIFMEPALQSMVQDRAIAMCFEVSALSIAMAGAAYSQAGAVWVDTCLEYLNGNRRLFFDGIAKIDGLSMSLPDATYLGWVSCNIEGRSGAEIGAAAGLHVLAGDDFGAAFARYFRLNFGTQRQNVEKALDMLGSTIAA